MEEVRDAEHLHLVRRLADAAGVSEPRRIERVPEGVGNHVYYLGDELVVRLGTGSDAQYYPRMLAILRAARRHVNVPEVVFEDIAAKITPFPSVVVRRLPGAPLSRSWNDLPPDSRMEALSSVAVALHALHELVPSAVSGFAFEEPWWLPRLRRIEHGLAAIKDNALLPPEWGAHMDAYVARHADKLRHGPPACIIHGDVTWGNFLVQNHGVSGVLDLDDSRPGLPEEDAWRLFFESELHENLWADPRSLQTLPGFDLLADGVVERFRIAEIESIVLLLTAELSWKTRDEAREDAFKTYREAFESRRYDDLLDTLAS